MAPSAPGARRTGRESRGQLRRTHQGCDRPRCYGGVNQGDEAAGWAGRQVLRSERRGDRTSTVAWRLFSCVTSWACMRYGRAAPHRNGLPRRSRAKHTAACVHQVQAVSVSNPNSTCLRCGFVSLLAFRNFYERRTAEALRQCTTGSSHTANKRQPKSVWSPGSGARRPREGKSRQGPTQSAGSGCPGPAQHASSNLPPTRPARSVVTG